MIAKTEHLKKLAQSLVKKGKTMTFDELAVNLNANGFETSYGTSFTGGRGVAKLVNAVYDRLDAEGLGDDAANVASAFTNANGDYSYN